jgi:hypothetical protein
MSQSSLSELKISSENPSISTGIFKEKTKTIPEMVVNGDNVGPLINQMAMFLANQFDGLPYNFTVTHVRSAICRVKSIKNAVIFDAVLSHLKTKPYKNLASTKPKKEKLRKEGEEEIIDNISSSEGDEDEKDINNNNM